MPARWKHYDSGLLTLRLPADWGAEEHAPGLVLLRDPAKDLAISLSVNSPAAIPAAPALKRTPLPAGRTGLLRQAEEHLARWLRNLPHVQTKQPPHPLTGTYHPTAEVEGRERTRLGVRWWKRLWRRGPLTRWRLWAVENTHLVVLASCSGRPEVVEYYRKTLDQIIASIQLPDRELLVGRPFTEAVASLARGYFPRTSIALVDDAHLQFGVCHVDIGTLHRRYLASPEHLSQHVRAFFRDLQRLNDTGPDQNWEDVRGQIMPALVEAARLGRYGPHCVQQEWINDLHIVYVIDEEGGYRALTDEECEAWGVELEELHEQALENLVNRSAELTMEGSRAEGYTMLALSVSDPYNAARLLLPDLHRKLREHLGVTFYAAIPSREFMLAFSTTREDVLARVRAQIGHDYRRVDNPVSPKIFLVTPDGITGDPCEAENFVI